MSSTLKIITLIVVLAVLAYFGYSYFFNSDVTDVIPPENDIVVGQDILALIGQLKKVNIDPSLISSPLFSNLKDFSISLIPEAVGRIDPFASVRPASKK